MNLRPTILPCLAAALILTACDDSTGPSMPGSPAEAKSLLTAAKWLPAAHTVSPGFDMEDNGVIVTNIFAIEEACGHDDVMQFTADGKWSVDDGPTKCDPDDPQVVTGTWALNATADSISMTTTGESVEDRAKITALSATQFSITASSDNWPDEQSRTEVFTWKAK